MPDGSWPEPRQAILTAVFSWHYPILEAAIREARRLWPRARLTLSGVLARRMGESLGAWLGAAVLNSASEAALDALRPDYALVPEWDASVVITSKGVCPRECSHCDASWRKKGLSRLITAWPTHLHARLPRVEVWDNTLMLTPRAHYEEVADTLARFGRPVDMVCGIAPGGIEEDELCWRLHRLRDVRLTPVRLECNTTPDLDRFRRLLAVARRTFPEAPNFRAFAVINTWEGPVEAWRRLEHVEAEGVQVDPISFTPHDWLRVDPYISAVAGWTLADLRVFQERWSS
jgi:hypothetical protein